MMQKKENKRYYWLKLPKAYFNQLEQKKMRRQEHGKDMQIVYLRMMLSSIDKGGYIYYQGVYDTIEEELAEEFDEDVNIVIKTIEFLKNNHMISISNELDCFIPEVLEHIGSEGESAERMRKLRAKKTSHCDNGVTKSDINVIPCDTEKELEKELEKETRINYQQIADMYNDTCVSFPKVTKLSESRKKAIKARLKLYTLEDFQKLFNMAEESDFLKGANSLDWSATFDWLIADGNMCKVLSGNYSNKKENSKPKQESSTQTPQNNRFHNFHQRTYDFEELEKRFLE